MFTNLFAYLTAGAMAVSTLSGCTAQTTTDTQQKSSSDSAVTAYASFTAEYSNRDTDATYGEYTKITLSGNTATVDGSGASVNGADIKITAEGTYLITGTLTGGSVTIDAPELAKVQLVLSGADITSADGPAINEIQCDKLFVTLENSNTLTDTELYTLNDGEDEPNATLFTKHDMTINGNGTLSINGNYMHGINTKDDLKITGGTINVTSKEDGVRGRDSVFIKDGTLNVNAGGDGVKSNNDSAEDKGRISIDGGTVNITAAFDGIQAESVLQINGGTLDIKSGNINAEVKTEGFGGMGDGMPMMGGNPQNRPDGENMTPPEMPTGDFAPPTDANRPEMPEGMDGDNRPEPPMDMGMPADAENGNRPERANGMGGGRGGKGGMRPNDTNMTPPDNMQTPTENTAQADTQTDTSDSKKAIKSANAIYINGGIITASSEDDTIHSDINVEINNGTITLSTADDAIHAEYNNTINGGTINITKSYEGIEGKVVTINGGTVDIISSDDTINAADPATSGNAQPGRGNDSVYIEITGGTVNAKSGFDGLDSNGNIFIRGGNITLDSPTNGMDCAIDCDGKAYIYGGTAAASGASGSAFAGESEQASLALVFTSQQSAGTKISLYDEDGTELASVTPTQSTRGVVFSHKNLKVGKTYTVKAGDITVSAEQTSISTAVNESGSAVSGGNGMGGGRGSMPQNTQ